MEPAAAAGLGNGSGGGGGGNGSLGPGGGGAWAPPYSPAGVAAVASAVGFLIAFTVAGNALVVLAVRTRRALRGPQHLFLVSLAGADLLVAALVMPLSLAHELMGGWALGAACCRVYLALDVLCCTASIVHLCAISLDRYFSVTRAVDYPRRRTARRVKAALAGAWLVSGLVSLPPLVSPPAGAGAGGGGRAGGSGAEGAPPWPPCQLNDQTWYILASCGASFFAPCLVMLLVYARLYRVAQRRRRSRSLSRSRRAAGGAPTGPGAGDEAAAAAPREKRSSSVVLGVVLGAFVLCWSPFFFSYSLYAICREACRLPEPLFKLFFWIGYCNSSLNPVIYTVFNRDFRRAFKHILFGRRRRRWLAGDPAGSRRGASLR